MSALARFATFVALEALGAAWMLIVTAPVLTGVPATWASAPLLIFAVPAIALMVIGYVTTFE